MIGEQYIINHEDWKLFCELYEFINEIAEKDKSKGKCKDQTEKDKIYYPKTAIRTFGIAVGDENDANRIVCFVLALDGLIINDHSSACKFSSRLSILLGDNDEDRKYIFDFMKEMYKFRNLYVHDSDYKEIKINDIGLSFQDASNKLEKYARIAFLRYLSI